MFDQIYSKFPTHEKQFLAKILELIGISGNRIAFDADADGIVSASIIKSSDFKENMIFIPMKIKYLKNNSFLQYITTFNWCTIIDLPPFSLTKINLYCDHHASNEGLQINSDLILFDSKAPSSASLLFDYFGHKIKHSFGKLVEITNLIDSGKFLSDPPLSISSKEDNVDKIWFLNDICDNLQSVEEINKLIKLLGKRGLDSLFQDQYIKIYNKLTITRIDTQKFVDELKVTESTCLLMKNKSLHQKMLIHLLYKQGVKVLSIIYTHKEGFSFSIRINPYLKKEEKDFLGIKELGEKLGGGGHESAVGGMTDKYQTIIRSVKRWSVKKNQKFCFIKVD